MQEVSFLGDDIFLGMMYFGDDVSLGRTSQIQIIINTKNNTRDSSDAIDTCCKSRFYWTIIAYFNDFKAKVQFLNRLPNHNVCHICSLSPAHSLSACNCIDSTKRIFISRSFLRIYVSDVLPSSLIDSNVSLRWKQRKSKKLGCTPSLATFWG
jgi:hypothetical protein